MDDIDRLDKSEIQAVFKLVKLSADFQNTAYVLAFDEKMVAAALHERYSSAGLEAGRNFLEKIIQVPLNLPKISELSLRKLCFQGVDQALSDSQTNLTENQVQEFVRYFTDGFRGRFTTPRICKRYANALSFSLPILKGEVHPVDLMLVEGLRIFHPLLYEKVRDNKDVFIGQSASFLNGDGNKEKTKKMVEDFLEGTVQNEVESVKSLLKYLFPKLSGTLTNVHYGSEWEKKWEEEKRITSNEYFDRYFSYSVPEGDISDLSINQFLDSVSGQSPDNVMESLCLLVNQSNAEKVVAKLRQKEGALSKDVSRKLCIAIASCGAIFPNPDQFFFHTTAWSQAAILVHKLLLNLQKGKERLDASKATLAVATPLPFAVECFVWLRSSDDKPESEQDFSKDDERILGTLIAERIKEESPKSIFYLDYGKNCSSLLWVWNTWSSNKGDVCEYLLNTFRKDKRNVMKFLKTFLNTAWEMETGIPRIGNFERRHYDRVAEYIEPEIIYGELKKSFGEELEKADDMYKYEDDEVEKKVAFQFAAIYHFVNKESENS